MKQRILIAGIGNIFLGDDGFGVEVVRHLVARKIPEGVQVVDYGIRGMDLAYALLDDYDALIFVDAAQRGGAPGTLYLIEVDSSEQSGVATMDAHGMDPVKVLNLARALGAKSTPTYVLACEPGFIPEPDSEDVVMELTAPVQAAIDEAVQMLESLITKLSSMTQISMV